MNTTRQQGWVSFATGLLFAIGLGVGGMTQPAKVVGFLDFFGRWDPSLMFVMGGALSVHAIVWRLVGHKPTPKLSTQWFVPTRRDLDRKLLGGAAISASAGASAATALGLASSRSPRAPSKPSSSSSPCSRA
jgi:hypothetical protein